MDDISKFFAMVLPLGTPEAYCNIHYKVTRSDGSVYWTGLAAQGMSDFMEKVDYAYRSLKACDVFFCTSAQSQAEKKVGRTGRTFMAALRSSEHAVALKSVFLDIDTQHGEYANAGEALKAVGKFIADVGLPKASAIVASGSGGVHVYWAFDQPIPTHKWIIMAEALKAAAQDKGLLIDPAVTADASRILRIPGTLNNKHDPAVPVRLLRIGETVPAGNVLKPLIPWVKKPELPPRTPTTEGSELSEGIANKSEPLPVSAVAEACPFVEATLANGGDYHLEPLWKDAIAIAKHCQDSLGTAHQLSCGHPQYSPVKTEEKLQAAIDRDIGWPYCSTIANDGARECADCPHKDKGKSPLHHARAKVFVPAPVNHAQSDDLPTGFSRAPDGTINRLVQDDDGAVKPYQMFPYPMYDAWMQDEKSATGWTLHFTTKIANRPKHVSATLNDLLKQGGIQAVFSTSGMPVKEATIKTMKEFIVSWVSKLQGMKDKVVSSTTFGWVRDDAGKLEGFAYGGRVWTEDDDRPAASADVEIMQKYTPMGSLTPWVTAAEFISSQQRPDLNTLLASAFSGPLVMFTDEYGLMINAYSLESGIGKTATMRTAQAVWGDPHRALAGVNDTPNQVTNTMGRIRHLTAFWDELKGEHTMHKFVEMSFQLTQGKERARLNADISQRKVGTWQTMLVSAANDSLIEPVIKYTKSTMAGLYRMFEFPVEKVQSNVDQPTAAAIFGALNNNFGHAGLEYAKFLGANFNRVAKDVKDTQSRIFNKTTANQEERFWIANIAVILCGAGYANELGLTNIDLDQLEEFLITVLGNMRKEINDTPVDMRNSVSVTNVLSQFLKAMSAKHTLVTSRIHVGRGRPAAGSIAIIGDPSKLERVVVHRGKDDKIMRIASTELTSWLSTRGYSRHAFSKALTEDFGAKDTVGILGSGTTVACSKEYLIEIDLNDARFKDFLDD